ncbi:MAG: chloride channel protein [Planctomycetaceae bacterium]|nr:chloride channel protein [Planctomycetaceae bacterium]
MYRLRKALRTIDVKASGKWIVLSILVGIVAGIGAILFDVAGQVVIHSSLVHFAAYAPREAVGEHRLFEHGLGAGVVSQPWLIVAVMTVGGLLSGLLVYSFAPDAEGHGTDAAIDAFHNKRGLIRWRIPVIKTLASAITIGTGGSAGREGPIAQIGAGFGSVLATRLKLSTRDRRIMLAAGMGAGVGAIFRAPLAGALFAAEILYSESDFEADVVIPAATASIIGYSVYCLSLPGEIRYAPLFALREDLAPAPTLELLPFAALAVILAAVGVLYIKVFYGLHGLIKRIPIIPHVKPAIGAALAGCVGIGLYLAFQQDRRVLAVLSTGYGTLQDALTNTANVGVGVLLAVALVKILTTSLTISSGGSGGVFGPSMVIGGCTGAAVGLMFQRLWPALVQQPEAYAIVGMAGFFAGCAHAPFSTIIMVSEMTGGYELLLPTMWVSTLCFMMMRRWKLYSKQVPSRLESPAHRGDFLVDILEGMAVREVYDGTRSILQIPESMPLHQIVHALSTTKQHYFPVVNTAGDMVGIFSGDDIRRYLYDQTIWQLATASDVMNSEVVSVTPDDDLNVAMRAFTAVAIDELPVVDPANRQRLLGTLRHKETIAFYNRRLMEYKRAQRESNE